MLAGVMDHVVPEVVVVEATARVSGLGYAEEVRTEGGGEMRCNRTGGVEIK